MDFHSAMETFAEAWMAANTKPRPDTCPDTQRDEKTDGHRADEPANAVNGTASRQASPDPTSPQQPNITQIHDHDEAKSLAIHIIVECIQIPQVLVGTERELQGHIEIDSFIVLPSFARFSDILQIVLSKTGYLDELPYARGYLQLRNWKPVPLEQVAESETKSIHDVLSAVAPITTLYVRLYTSTNLRCSRDIKDRLLRLLITNSHHILTSAGCPLDEGLLFTLIRGNGEISEETIRQFETWWAMQAAHASRGHLPVSHHSSPMNTSFLQNSTACVQEKNSLESIHPTMQTRMRTSFDPEYELPRLHKWFAENQHPTRIQIQQYVNELNSLESRRGKKALDLNNVVYWFKNARAAFKRQEYRSLNGGKSLSHDEASISDSEDHSSFFSIGTPTQHSNRSPGVHNSILHQPFKTLNPPSESAHKTIKEEETRSNNRSPSSELTAGKFSVRSSPPKTSPSGTIEPPESEVEMSDEDDCRSRESGGTTERNKDSLSPGITGNAISLPPYPSMQSLGQSGHVERLPYAVMPSPLFQHSMMYMAQYMPQVSPFTPGLHGGGLPEERRKRNRTFIDPVSEVPRLEQWFTLNTHPSHNLILKYTEELNRMPYRQKFPKLEPKNIQFWFKNRRAKCKRLRVAI